MLMRSQYSKPEKNKNMYKPIHRAFVVALSLSLSGAALAAGAAPANTEQRAARGVTTAFVAIAEVSDLDNKFVDDSRQIIDAAFVQLRASTSFAALLAPGGVTLNCPVSGTFNARIGNGWPRVLKLDWVHCVSIEYGSRNEVDGPAEATLSANSLEPTTVLSIRLGDGNRDHISDSTPEIPDEWFGGQTASRNLRLTGILPMTREYPLGGRFLGRHLVEAKGFVRRVQRLPDYNDAGEPSVEFYNYDSKLSTDSAWLTGTYTVNGFDNRLEVGLITGKISGRFIYPLRPTKPTKTLDKWFKGTGFSVRRTYDNDLSKSLMWVDGKVEGDFHAYWHVGCGGADTYTFRTRAPWTHSPNAYSSQIFDSGELVIDGSSVATFSATGTEPYVDLLGHVLLKVPGVGTFNYDYPESVLYGPLADAGSCTP